MYFYRIARRHPERTKQQILAMARKALGPDYDVAMHFTPSYYPWDQRLCLVPDSDLFQAIRAGQASVAAGHAKMFTETGIRPRCGRDHAVRPALTSPAPAQGTGLASHDQVR